MRDGLAMKREGEIGLFREEGEVSEFLAFRAGAEITREVAFDDGVGASLNRDGLSEIAFCRVEDGHIAKTPCNIRMYGPQRLLQDCQSALIERLRLCIIAQISVEVGEIFERNRDLWVFRAERFLSNG